MAGGIGGIGREGKNGLDGLRDRERERERAGWGGDGDASECSSGRGKKKESGLKENLDRSGGLRTLRYILNDLSARFACGTYLGQTLVVNSTIEGRSALTYSRRQFFRNTFHLQKKGQGLLRSQTRGRSRNTDVP
jgi:hypothetical protein